MFDYARNMQLALSDAGRRVALKAAAGIVIAVGAGFLIAALWSFLAWNLGWGPVGASLAIGLLFVVVGIVFLSMSKKVNHPVPSTDELKAEVETRLSLATDAAMEKARIKAVEVVDNVENRVHSFVDDVTYKAERFVDNAEAKVQGFTRNVAGQAAQEGQYRDQFLFQGAAQVVGQQFLLKLSRGYFAGLTDQVEVRVEARQGALHHAQRAQGGGQRTGNVQALLREDQHQFVQQGGVDGAFAAQPRDHELPQHAPESVLVDVLGPAQGVQQGVREQLRVGVLHPHDQLL